jgi:hypothetical protein
VDQGRGTRLSDGAVVLFAALTIAVVGVLATLQTQAQLARTKVAAARQTEVSPGTGASDAAPDIEGSSSQGLAQFGRLPRCVKRGVLRAAVENLDSLPRARPPCWTRREQVPRRGLPQRRWRGAGLGQPWDGRARPGAGGFAHDSD